MRFSSKYGGHFINKGFFSVRTLKKRFWKRKIIEKFIIFTYVSPILYKRLKSKMEIITDLFENNMTRRVSIDIVYFFKFFVDEFS